MYEDNKNYIAPSVTVLRQDPTITTSGELSWGVGDNENFFPED